MTTKKTLYLGPDLSLPMQFVTETLAILGIRGSGKTTAAVALAEEIVKLGYPVVVDDPLDVWWGVRSSRNGKEPGLPFVIFGGRHGDVPLEEGSGDVIARFVMRERVPVVLSKKHLSHAGQARFSADFANRLYRDNDEPLHVIYDEAARILPQNLAGRPDLAKCVAAVQQLTAEGRVNGIGVTLVGQRAARINKDALSQCETLFVMRTTGPHDRKALEEWVNAHGTPQQIDAMMRDSATLPTGTGYVWSPHALGVFKRVRFRDRETFDSSRTPQVGERRLAPKAFASVDLEKLKGEIAATIERAKADDPVALRAEIQRLQAALRKAAQTGEKPASERVETVEMPILSTDTLKALQAAVAALSGAADKIAALNVTAAFKAAFEAVATGLSRDAEAALGDAPAAVAEASRKLAADAARLTRYGGLAATPSPAVASRSTRALPAPAPSVAPRRETPAARDRGDGTLVAGQRRILDVLARCDGTLPKRQLSTLADVQIRNGSLAAYLRNLVNLGYVEDGGSTVHLLGAGAAAIGVTVRHDPPSTQELVQHYNGKLVAGQKRVLEHLVAAYPNALPKTELSELSAVQIRNGSLAAYLRKLRNLGLADELDKKTVRASETLFLR